ncbi:MAG: glycoside hydrolase family 3 N-terminal domain-containing protein [Acidobacteriota bacterium]|nr:glycoside hydrolase family 3 N-terminal domain-containing protein [Acidobacteriota bacterium]
MRKLLAFVLVFLMMLSAPAFPDEVADAANAYAGGESSGARWAERTQRHMSLEEKVGQLFMIWAKVDFTNFEGPDYQRLRDQMRQFHVGGFAVTAPMENGLLLHASPLDAAALTNHLQHDSALPLIFAADFERGLPMRLHGGTGFPHAMAFGAAGNLDYAYQFGRVTAEESRAIGVHWNFYPDADINSNPNNPIINTRSFGEDPAAVSGLVKAFIRGTHDGHALATAKHFPGHGDTDTDSHLAVPRINASRERLEQVELVPFREAIAAGVDSIMVGHLLVPALEPNPNRVATVSPAITTQLLKNELGFRGIVVTDAMDMNGLLRLYGGNTPQAAGRAAVDALKAGADLILIPGDLEGAYNGVLKAVRSGELSEARIDESVGKLLRAKAALGLHKNRYIDLDKVNTALNQPSHVALAQKVADDALTLVRDSHRILPLEPGAPGAAQPFLYHAAAFEGNRVLLVVFTDDARGDNGRRLARELRLRVPDARVIYVDEANSAAMTGEVLQAAARAERVVAAVYVTPSAGRTAVTDAGSPALDKGPGGVLGELVRAAADKTVVAALGSPYILVQYPAIQNYLCTFSNAPVSEASAVKFLFGEMPARGHLPITLPGIAPRGYSAAQNAK